MSTTRVTKSKTITEEITFSSSHAYNNNQSRFTVTILMERRGGDLSGDVTIKRRTIGVGGRGIPHAIHFHGVRELRDLIAVTQAAIEYLEEESGNE